MIEPDVYHKYLVKTGSPLPQASAEPVVPTNSDAVVHPAQGLLSLPREELPSLLLQPAVLQHLSNDKRLYELLVQARHCNLRNEGPAKKLSKQ